MIQDLRRGANVQLVRLGQVVGRRISQVLRYRDPSLNGLNVEMIPRVAVSSRHMAGLAGLRLRAGRSVLVAILAIEPLRIGCLFHFGGTRAIRFHFIEHRQDDSVTATAHLRRLQVGVELRFDAQARVHRIGGDLVVLERAVQLIGWNQIEVPVEIAEVAVRIFSIKEVVRARLPGGALR